MVGGFVSQLHLYQSGKNGRKMNGKGKRNVGKKEEKYGQDSVRN